jgi:hypothetical protein
LRSLADGAVSHMIQESESQKQHLWLFWGAVALNLDVEMEISFENVIAWIREIV